MYNKDIHGDIMILGTLLGLLACGSHEADSSFNTTHFEDASVRFDISHLESPCLDGVIKSMLDRECEINMSTTKSGMIRYSCVQDNPENPDLWTTRTFSSWVLEDTPDQEFLDRNGYKTACVDWSLSLFYR